MASFSLDLDVAVAPESSTDAATLVLAVGGNLELALVRRAIGAALEVDEIFWVLVEYLGGVGCIVLVPVEVVLAPVNVPLLTVLSIDHFAPVELGTALDQPVISSDATPVGAIAAEAAVLFGREIEVPFAYIFECLPSTVM